MSEMAVGIIERIMDRAERPKVEPHWQKIASAPLHEHLRAAEFAWDKIHTTMPQVPQAMHSTMLDEFRKDAARTFWLYPVVEGRRGMPA